MDISACDRDGRNAVHYAALHHEIDTLRTILSIPNHGIDLNKRDSSGRTPLFWSAGYNSENSSDATQDRTGNEYFECMKLLLNQAGVNPNIKDSNGENVFLRCVMNGRFNSVKYLLENAEKYKINILVGDNDGDNALYFAVWFGYANVLKLLLDTNKFDVNSCGKNSGYSPLSIICKSPQMHHFDCFKLLLSRKDIDVNKYTPLLHCLSRQKTQYVRYMINNNNKSGGYKIDWEKHTNPSVGNLLHHAVWYGNSKIVKLLVKAAEQSGYKFDINAIGGANKETALNTCVLKLTEARRARAFNSKGDYIGVSKADKQDIFDLFKYLLSQPGINPNIKDLSKDTSWLHANYFGLIDYVKYFVENSQNGKKAKEVKNGENKEEKEENGGWIVDFSADNSDRTCIEYAAFQGHYEIIRYLLECDKFLNEFENIEDHVKRALHLCMAKHQSIKTKQFGANHLKIFESLLYFLANNKFEIDVSKKPYINKGATMIQSCVLMNRYDFVKFLIENDSRSTTKTNTKSTKEDSKLKNLAPTKLGYTIDWSVRDNKNHDILFYAVKNSNFKMLRLLFNTKSFVESIKNINQTYPLKAKKLMVTVTTSDPTAGADTDDSTNNFISNKGSILHQCVKSLTNWSAANNICENLKCFKLLCDLKGINVNIQNSSGYTPLMWAIKMGKTSFVEHLVNKHEKGKLNVDFELRTKQLDYDCLSIAALKANYLVMRCLLNANNKRCQINVNNVSKMDGNTALHLCVLLKGHASQFDTDAATRNFDFDKHTCFKLLLSQPGIDTNIKNKDGKDVLTICTENKLDEFSDLLPSKG